MTCSRIARLLPSRAACTRPEPSASAASSTSPPPGRGWGGTSCAAAPASPAPRGRRRRRGPAPPAGRAAARRTAARARRRGPAGARPTPRPPRRARPSTISRAVSRSAAESRRARRGAPRRRPRRPCRGRATAGRAPEASRTQPALLGDQLVAGVEHGRVALAGEQRLEPARGRAEGDQLVLVPGHAERLGERVHRQREPGRRDVDAERRADQVGRGRAGSAVEAQPHAAVDGRDDPDVGEPAERVARVEAVGQHVVRAGQRDVELAVEQGAELGRRGGHGDLGRPRGPGRRAGRSTGPRRAGPTA